MAFTASVLGSLLLVGATASPWGPPPGAPLGPPGPPGGIPSFSGPDFGIIAQSPAYTWLYEYPLPVPPIAQPAYTEHVNGQTIQYFELTIEAFDQQVYPNLGPAHLIGYSKQNCETSHSFSQLTFL